MKSVDANALEVLVSGERAGWLAKDEGGQLSFSYDGGYRGPDLSIRMPVSEAVYQGRVVAAWFSNLLPDDVLVRRGMAAEAGTSTGVFPLLSHFGLDLPGAVQVVSPESWDAALSQPQSYARLSSEEIGERLRTMVASEEKRRAHAWATSGERWSLGGMQAKIALREHEGEWFECLGDAASNVIVKPGVSHLRSQALDECVTMRLAALCGLPTASARAEQFDGESAIVVERYDRYTLPSSDAVVRIHQEDFCQATATVAERKYAADGGPSSLQVMKALEGAEGTSRQRFVDALLFNCLTASTDAHAKNYSLLHPEGSRYLLAPLYDLASVAPYMERGRVYRLAMSIGGENRVGRLRRSSLGRFARANGLDEAALADRTEELAELIKRNLDAAFNAFPAFEGLDELASRFVPRVTALCSATQRNVRVEGRRFKPVDIAKWGS